MVVVCESCSTRFRIDDARIPAKGRLVRCSNCKATFIAKPEDARPEEVIEEVVAEVTGSGGAPVPEPATDLFAAGGGELGDTASGIGDTAVGIDTAGSIGDTAVSTGTTGEEERWEFDEEPRKPHAEPGPGERFEAFGKPEETEPAASPLDEIGDPTEWDLLRGSVEREARQAEFIEPVPAAPARARKPEAPREPARRRVPAEPVESAAPLPIRRRSLANVLGDLAGSVLGAGAWLALGLLTLLGARPLLPGEAARAVAPPAPRTIGLPDGEAREVRGRFVENAFAPSLFVVEGELTRPDPDPRLGLRVHFLSALGARVGGTAWAGTARSARDLRERAPALLRSESEASAPAVARGRRFAAVFTEVPADAAGFELALEPLPGALAPEAPAAAQAASDAPNESSPEPSLRAEAARGATASSPPAPLPSSE